MPKGFAIAIDGPVAAGKGTVARLLAEKLSGFHLYTGAMYRCVALYCLENKLSTDFQTVVAVLPEIQIDLNGNQIILNGADVSEKIKQRRVTLLVSKIAAIAQVRQEMVAKQRLIGQAKIDAGEIVIAEGRDIATKVFPNARIRIFLTAAPEIRAKRRFEQMGGKNNRQITVAGILKDTLERDKQDSERTTDPLVKDPANHDYFVVDNSFLTERETVDVIIRELNKSTT